MISFGPLLLCLLGVPFLSLLASGIATLVTALVLRRGRTNSVSVTIAEPERR